MFDLMIRGGRIIDGSGTPGYPGDIGIQGDRITAIGKLDPSQADRVIDAAGLVVCPGFIDMHTHSDIMLLANPRHEAKVMQGVTTDLLGLDGLSYAPLSPDNLRMMRQYLSGLNGAPNIAWAWNSVAEFLDRFDRKVAINVAYLVPHNALRLETMGFVDRTANAAELAGMQALMAQGMREGAVGFSTGLDYFPGRYSDEAEMVKICEVVAEHNGISVWHVRKNDLGLIESIKEVIRVAERTGVKAHFSHFSVSFPTSPGKSVEMLALVDEARARGADLTFDSYPYIAQSTLLLVFLPRWSHEGGPEAILERLSQTETRERICTEIRALNVPWDKVILTCVPSAKNSIHVGKTILEAAEMAGREVVEFACDLLLEEELAVGHLSLLGNEEDMQRIMKHPVHTAGSDGILVGDRPNPRAWGTFPRFIARYSRELGVLSLEEVIRHMTSAPAQCLNLKDRGLVKEGFAADLVAFNSETITDKATFEEPKQYPVGIDYVLVNGAVVVDKGKHTGALKGRALLHIY
jgi:N-acyl-D-amino-acid deacylase